MLNTFQYAVLPYPDIQSMLLHFYPHVRVCTYDTHKWFTFVFRPLYGVSTSTHPLSRYWSSFVRDFRNDRTCSVTDVCSAGTSSLLVMPRTWPTKPPGLGIGHSLLGFSLSSIIFLFASSLSTSLPSSSLSIGLRLRRRFVGSAESLSVRGSTGQGIRCGAATTRKQTISVVVKSEAVMRLRGCMCGGMLTFAALLIDGPMNAFVL